MYIIDQVTIDVKKREFTVSGNEFPTQTFTFEQEDEWGSIKDHKGEFILDWNIWWDEQWGFQYSEPEQLEDGRWQTGSDYKNPEKMIFVDGNDAPFYDEKTLTSFSPTSVRPAKNSEQLTKEQSQLHADCVASVKKIFEGEKIEFESDEIFVDEAGNEINAVDGDYIYFDSGITGEDMNYPINHAGISDLIQILGILEDYDAIR